MFDVRDPVHISTSGSETQTDVIGFLRFRNEIRKKT
jgi:hypothetical protein